MNENVAQEPEARPSELAAIVLLAAVARDNNLPGPQGIMFYDYDPATDWGNPRIEVKVRRLEEFEAWVRAVGATSPVKPMRVKSKQPRDFDSYSTSVDWNGYRLAFGCYVFVTEKIEVETDPATSALIDDLTTTVVSK